MLIPLLIIFNKSYDEGKIPEMWRYAKVIQKRFENSSTKSIYTIYNGIYRNIWNGIV